MAASFRCLYSCLLLCLGLLLASCSAPASRSPVRLPPPPPSPRAVQSLPDDHEDLFWIPQASDRLQDPVAIGFAAAREDFWNRNADQAAQAFAALLGSNARFPGTNHLRSLILQSYESIGDWAGSLPWYARLGMLETHPNRWQFARTLSSFPERTREWNGPDSGIPFELHRDHLVLVTARVQGRPVRLLVDTGFTFSFLVDSFAQANGVQPTSEAIRLSDANSSDSTGRLARVDLLELGPLTLRHQPVVIAPPRLLQRIAGPIDGVLGWDILRDLEVTWDFPTRQIFLRASERREAPTEPNLSGCELPILTVVGPSGYPLNLFLDTGLASGRAQLDRNARLLQDRMDLGAFKRSFRPQVSLGMHSIRVSWPRRCQAFAFHTSGFRFEMPAVLSRSMNVREGLVAIDGTIGTAPFQSGRLILDAPNRCFKWIPGAGAHDRSVLTRGSRGDSGAIPPR